MHGPAQQAANILFWKPNFTCYNSVRRVLNSRQVPIFSLSRGTLLAISWTAWTPCRREDTATPGRSKNRTSVSVGPKIFQLARRIFSALVPLQDYLLPAEYNFFPLHRRRALAPLLYLSKVGSERLLERLENSSLRFQCQGFSQNLVEWLGQAVSRALGIRVVLLQTNSPKTRGDLGMALEVRHIF